MQHYAAGIHFLNQEASVMVTNHRYVQCQLGCADPKKGNSSATLGKTSYIIHYKHLVYEENEKEILIANI